MLPAALACTKAAVRCHSCRQRPVRKTRHVCQRSRLDILQVAAPQKLTVCTRTSDHAKLISYTADEVAYFGGVDETWWGGE